MKAVSGKTKTLKNWEQITESIDRIRGRCVSKDKCAILRADSRIAISQLPNNSVSCIITSPPYGDLKNYGSKNQIGFGQKLEEYLPDLEKIFEKLLVVAKPGASMWIVLDMMKEAGETIPLPWEIISRCKNVGWTFQDLVIWDKGKSLPWSSRGKFRGVCEYILLLSKGKLKKFNLDAVRDSENLSSYWVQYPERYHPDGKAPSDLWHFPIPTQGTWSKKQSRHFCPFPIGLIARMVAISTDKDEIILDPFSGTGSVPAIASYLNRYGLGIEINSSFVTDFKKKGFDLIIEKAKEELPNNDLLNNSLRETIIKLRMQKYPKTLFSGLMRSDYLGDKARDYIEVFIIKSSQLLNEKENLDSGKLGKVSLQILLKEKADKKIVEKSVLNRTSIAPLSIFGIKVETEIIKYKDWHGEKFISSLKNNTWYVYKNGKFFKDYEKVTKKRIENYIYSDQINYKKMPHIISEIELSVEPPLKV